MHLAVGVSHRTTLPKSKRSHSPDIKGIQVLQNVTISVCDHTALLKSASAATTVNCRRTTTVHCPLYYDYGVDTVACRGPYFTGDRLQLYCVIPTFFMQHECHRVTDHRLTCQPHQPILTYRLPSITLQLPQTPVRFADVVLVRGAIRGNCFLIPLRMMVEICCWTI